MEPVEGADLFPRLRVPGVAVQRAKARVETVAAESEIRVDLAHNPGKVPERVVRNPVKPADGETRLPGFAAAVPRVAAVLVQWLWKPG